MPHSQTIWDDPDFVEHWNKTYGLDMSGAPIRPGIVFPWIEEGISKAGSLRLIDIGCGNGNLIKHFAKAAFTEMVGVDHGSVVIQSARKSVISPRVKFVHASATGDFPFHETGRNFDVVSSIFVVEEVPCSQFVDYCQTIHDVLAHKGCAFVFTNHPANALIEDHKSVIAAQPNTKFPDHQGYFDRTPTLYTLEVMNRGIGVEKRASYHHKTISDILNSFNKAGLSLVSMIEIPRGIVDMSTLNSYRPQRGDIPRFAGFVFERRD